MNRSHVAWIAALTLGLLAPLTTAGQVTEAPPPQAVPSAQPDPRLISPGQTLETFDAAWEIYDADSRRIDKLQEARLCFDFSQLDLPEPQEAAMNDLFRIMNRIEIVDADAIPPADSGTPYVYFPRPDDEYHRFLNNAQPGYAIELIQNENGEWRISPATVNAAGDMFRAFAEFPNVTGQSDRATTLGQQIRDAMPRDLRSTFLTVEYWQWIAIFLVIFAGVIIDFFVRALLSSLWYRIDKKRPGPTADREVLKKAVRPFGLVAAAAFWLAMINIGGISGTALDVLLLAIRVVLSFGGVWAAWRLTDLLASIALRKAGETENTYDDLLVPLVQRSVKIFLAAIGVIYIAKALHIDILPLLTGLGIGGLAVAFAAKDTIENFFGSVAVIVDQPFKVGDWINVEGVEGTVEELGFRSTRVRTFYNSLVTVPNAMLVRATVDNYGRREYRRWSTTLNVTYNTPPEKIEAFCEGIRELVRLHPYTRKDMFHVYFNAFGAHSLDIMLYIFFKCPDWAVELREKHRLGLDILRLADKMGVSFAFPTQTLELKQLDPNAVHEPAPHPKPTVETEAKTAGMLAAREMTQGQPWRSETPGPVTFAVSNPDSEHEMRGDGGSG